jgi:hypothetical protein
MHPPKMNKDGWYEYGGPAFLETRTLGNPSWLFRNTWWLDMNDERSYNRELLGEDQGRQPACSYGIYDRRDYGWRKMFTLTWGTSQKRTAMGCLAERRQLVVTLLQLPEFRIHQGDPWYHPLFTVVHRMWIFLTILAHSFPGNFQLDLTQRLLRWRQQFTS